MMGRICESCKEEPAGKAEYISFDYQFPKRLSTFMFKFRVFKQGAFCFSCEKKEHIRKFNEYHGKLILSDVDTWLVDWKFYLQFRKDRKGRASVLDDILISLSVLSSSAEWNWNVVDHEGIGLNPWWYSSYLYFTNLDDATQFALSSSYSSSHWEIHKIMKVVTRQDVIKSFKED